MDLDSTKRAFLQHNNMPPLAMNRSLILQWETITSSSLTTTFFLWHQAFFLWHQATDPHSCGRHGGHQAMNPFVSISKATSLTSNLAVILYVNSLGIHANGLSHQLLLLSIHPPLSTLRALVNKLCRISAMPSPNLHVQQMQDFKRTSFLDFGEIFATLLLLSK